MMALGGVGLIGVIILQVRHYVFSPQEKPPTRADMAVSFCLANCLLDDLAGQSGNVVLLFPERRLMDADTERSYEAGFVPALRHGHVGLHLRALRLQGVGRKAGNSLSAFKQALAQAQDALAVVSYAGVPAEFETLCSSEQPKLPPFYVFDPGGTTNWLGALKDGHIKAVVLPRPGVDPRDRESAGGMPQTILERFYLLARPANADQVAASLRARN